MIVGAVGDYTLSQLRTYSPYPVMCCIEFLRKKRFRTVEKLNTAKNGLLPSTSTVDYCKTFNSDVMRGIKVEPSSPSGAVDNDSRLHHSLLSSCYRPLTLSLQSQVAYITDLYKILSVKAVFSFQEDDGGVRGEVVVRLGDVVGEVVAYLVWRT